MVRMVTSQERMKLREKSEVAGANDGIRPQVEVRQEEVVPRDPDTGLALAGAGRLRLVEQGLALELPLVLPFERQHAMQALNDLVVALEVADVAERARGIRQQIHLREDRDRV